MNLLPFPDRCNGVPKRVEGFTRFNDAALSAIANKPFTEIMTPLSIGFAEI